MGDDRGHVIGDRPLKERSVTVLVVVAERVERDISPPFDERDDLDHDAT